MHSLTRSPRGFTLVEILVVVAIIAILAAILFPVFARARENARRVSCQSNLKQMALGFAQYTQDYNGKYPNRFSGPLAGGWVATLQPYLKSTQLFQCPSETTPPDTTTFSSPGYTDYSVNLYLGWNTINGGTNDGKNVAILTQPALSVLVADSQGSLATGTSLAYDTGCDYHLGCQAGLARFTEDARTQRHLDGQNLAFCDGHVKWYKGATATESTTVYNTCTPGTPGEALANTDCSPSTTVTSGSNPTYNLTP